jgi:nucleotide-binding universal stress UspA family protein
LREFSVPRSWPLNVFHTPAADPAAFGIWAIAIEQDAIERCATEQLQSVEHGIRALFEPLETPWRVIQEQGHPVDAILDVAERENVDLIVLGSRGLRGVKELLLGSVSSGVLHHSSCPVLIVRGDSALWGTAGFGKIVLTSDGSPCAQKAAPIAVEFARKFATSLTVLNVYGELSTVSAPGDENTLTGDSVVELAARQWMAYVAAPVRALADDAEVACTFVQKGGRPDGSHINTRRSKPQSTRCL